MSSLLIFFSTGLVSSSSLGATCTSAHIICVLPNLSSIFCLIPDLLAWVIIGTHSMMTVHPFPALTVMLETVVVLCSDIILVRFCSFIHFSLSLSSAFSHTCCSHLLFSRSFFSLIFCNSSSIFC